MRTRWTRSEAPLEQTWELTDLFPTNAAWEVELKHLSEDIHKIIQYKGLLGDGPEILLNCLQAEEELTKRMIRVSTYAFLRSAENGSDPINQANASHISAMKAKMQAALSFIRSEILTLPAGVIEQFLEKEERLETYNIYLLDLLQQKPHQLSPETESILASLDEVMQSPYTIYTNCKLADMEFDPIQSENGDESPVSFALYETRYEQSSNSSDRRKAYASFTKTLHQYKHTFASTYATEVKKQIVMARARKYESVTHMLLHPQKVTIDMYHNILDIIQKELSPHMQRLIQLKQRVLGLDKMMLCDLKAPLDPEYNPPVTFKSASKMVVDSLEILGQEYIEIMKQALENRWADYANTIGKRSGAFCSSPYGVHPYILMTWAGTMRSVFTLAHELGHAGHFALANRYQRIHNTRPSMYFVEAPSTLNEMLLGHYLLNKATEPRMRNSVIVQLLGTYYHNYVTHLLEGEMQRRVYHHAEAGKAITANVLCELKGDILSSFWGNTVDIDEGACLTWMRQPHYYMGLYPYTYAAGLTASTAVAQLIQEEGKPVADRWIEALKAGGTLSPLELMKMAGVDMTSPQPIKKAVAFVGSLVDELENSYNQ